MLNADKGEEIYRGNNFLDVVIGSPYRYSLRLSTDQPREIISFHRDKQSVEVESVIR